MPPTVQPQYRATQRPSNLAFFYRDCSHISSKMVMNSYCPKEPSSSYRDDYCCESQGGAELHSVPRRCHPSTTWSRPFETRTRLGLILSS